MTVLPTLRRAGAATLAAMLLAGCTMIPHYKRPTPPLARAWPAYATTGDAVAENPLAANLGWAEFFTDPRLRALIAIAIRENRDLREAAADIRRAQGQFDIQHASLFPAISGGGEAMFQIP